MSTQLLTTRDQPEALDRLVPLVDDELRRMARSQLAEEQGGHTLDTDAPELRA